MTAHLTIRAYSASLAPAVLQGEVGGCEAGGEAPAMVTEVTWGADLARVSTPTLGAIHLICQTVRTLQSCTVM